MDVEYVRFILALLFVLGLIGLLTFALRRFGLGGVQVSPGFRSKARNAARRVSVVEVTALDARHRLVLVRRDDVEHLILLGANSDLLIESNIPTSGDNAMQTSSFQETLNAAGEPKV